MMNQYESALVEFNYAIEGVSKDQEGKFKRLDLHCKFRRNRAMCYKDAADYSKAQKEPFDYKKCLRDLEKAKELCNEKDP
jgi:hypothetical protein